jgi:hypothetical protein
LPPEHDLEYVILLHAAYSPGDLPVEFEGDLPDVRREGAELQLPTLEQEQAFAPDANYRDPAAERDGEFRGRWLAGFAPVGNTELWVIVQRKDDEAVVPFTRLTRVLVVWLGLGAVLVLAPIGAALYWWTRQSRARMSTQAS